MCENRGQVTTISIYPILLAVYLIIYPILYNILWERLKWSKKDVSELAFSDEREKVIVAEATNTSYIILIIGLIVGVAIIGGLKLFSLFTHQNINIFFPQIASASWTPGKTAAGIQAA